MLRNQKSSLALFLGVVFGAALVATPAWAANITLGGAISTDDAVQLFDVTIAAPAQVDLRSYGYAGGIFPDDSGVTAVPPGGFDTILTLFTASGQFLSENDDGAGVDTDPSTGLAADARITTNLAAGSYILALTQYDNFSRGSLADGFVETGNPNFTANPNFTTGGPCPGNLFRDISGTAGRCRNGNWAVNFANVASVSPVAPVPEPGALLLASVGLALLLAGCCRRRRTVTLLAVALVAALAGMPVQAQTNCPASTSGPDYCHVSDFLSGQRSLLNVTDLQLVNINPSYGPVYTRIGTSNSQQSVSPPFYYGLQGIDASKPALQFSAHMFNQLTATTLTPLHGFNGSFALWIQGIANAGGISAWVPLSPGDEPDVNCGAVADFTQDGFDDLALGLGDGRIFVVSPNNTDPASQPINGAFHSSTPLTRLNVLQAMAAGDFNGDGRKELAGLTLIPDNQAGGGGLALIIYTVDPKTLAVTPVTTLVLNTPDASPNTPITHTSMARGRFTSNSHDQLAIAYATDTNRARVEFIDFDANTLNAHEVSYLNPTVPGITHQGGYIQVETGQFGLPSHPYDQIVYHNSSPDATTSSRFFALISVDPVSDALTLHNPIIYDAYPCSKGIQVGNFDHRQNDPLNPKQTQRNPNAQIAFLYCSTQESDPNLIMNIYSVDPSNLNVSNPPDSALPLNIRFSSGATFAATDFQGRSLVLGEPTKISINSAVQPSVVVGVPPMHVDFVSPDPVNNAPPKVLNLSVVPEGFKTTYEQESSTGNESGATNTTSWSFGAKESFSDSLTVGLPNIAEVNVSDTLTAAQNLKGSAEREHGTYQRKAFNLSATTGFGDEVSYLDSQFNIWVYPVLGKTVCPAAKPNCQNSEKIPLTIQFSAPSSDALTHATQGQALQWYQPPWEPGNILSYPANLQQLQSIYPNLSQLTTGGVEFLTDTSTITQKTTWSVTTKDTATTSFDQNYSFENDFSESAGFSDGGIKLQAGLKIDLSGSYGLSSLNKNTTELGLSTGVQVSKPGTFPSFQNYGYFVAPYIFGTTKPGGSVDSQPLSSDVQTFGALRAMFTADPLASNAGAGAWWQQAYSQAPDVALNHPSRWQITTPGLSNPIPSNCLATGTGASQMDCAELTRRSPDNPWLSVFHQMRGFFISSSQSPGQGPQLAQTTAGDALTLQARVYNYSFKEMPTDSQVHVRFYFMPWNKTVPAGDSVLIGEETLPPIPPFSNVSGAQPNWVLANTTFDTSKYDQTKNGNVSVVFWVLVWMQTPDGKLVPEMPGHGLTRIPGTLKSIADVAEECQSDGNCYSNNLGLYHQIFYIAPPTLGTAPAPVPKTALVDIGKVDVSATRISPNDTVVVSATLSASGADATAISTNFYDGDPQQGGRLFNVERTPYITQNDPYPVQTLYRTNTCGVHQLFVVVNEGQSSEIIRRAPPVRVDCSQFMLRSPVGTAGQKLSLK